MGEENTIVTFREDLRMMASRSSDVFTADFKTLPYLVNALTLGICYGKQPTGTKMHVLNNFVIGKYICTCLLNVAIPFNYIFQLIEA